MITKEQALMSVRLLDAGCSNNTERDIVNDATATILQFIEQQSASTSVQVPEGWAVRYFDTVTNTWEWESIWPYKQFANGHLNNILSDPHLMDNFTQASVIPMVRVLLNQPQEG